jgi:RecA-family ATPase
MNAEPVDLQDAHAGAYCDHRRMQAEAENIAEREAIQAEGNGDIPHKVNGERRYSYEDLAKAYGEGLIAADAAKAKAKAAELLQRWTLPEPMGSDEFESARPAPDCIVDGYLYADVAQQVAPGGTGKTTLDLYEAAHIALGMPLYGLKIEKPGPVLILTAEDSREMLVARLRGIAEALNLNDGQKRRLRELVRISDVCGRAFKLTMLVDDVVMPTPELDALIEGARSFAPVLINIDPMISFGIGEARVNDAEQGLIDAARRIRGELGCCVRYVHHTGKTNAREGAIDQYAGRGGSAMPDGARMVAVLQPLDADAWLKATATPLLDGGTGILLARPKLSFAPPQPDILISRKGYAFKHTGRLKRTKTEELELNCAQVLRRIVCDLDADRRHTKNSLEALDLGMSRGNVRDAIATLLAGGRLEFVPEHRRGGAQGYFRPVGSRCSEGEASPKTVQPDV